MGWTIISVSPLIITAASTSSLQATVGSANLIKLVDYTGGLTPFVYSITPALPSPLTLDSTTGYVSGNPTTSTSTATYIVTVSDSVRQTTSTRISLYADVVGGTGEISYTSPGTYSFTVPLGITSLSIVTVGGGGGGLVASAGYLTQAATDGGDSSVNRGNTILVGAGGGKCGTNGTQGGSVLAGTAGYSGGAGGGGSGRYGGPGGGAGGYTSAGGNSAGVGFDSNFGGGGGVGLYGGTAGGQGGQGQIGGLGGSGGSNGTSGRSGSGGAYGGGGAGNGYGLGVKSANGGGGGALAYVNTMPVTPGEVLTVIVGAAGKQELRNYIGYIVGGQPGAKGAVRIIWGYGRSFPSNAS